MQRRNLIVSVEGLRAVAVLAVLLFHLDLHGVAGGYIGVDVFFVISGYIITRNLVLQMERGDFALGQFYYARFRRLIPALAVVTLATLAGGLALMPPRDLAELGQSALFTMVSLSNVLFWWQADYFDAASHTKPLLHTWSLGVEEQFYLVWPATLLLLRRYRIAAIACVVLGVASIGAAVLLARDHASAVLYLSPFRVYQFMAGAVVAVAGWSFAGRAGDVAHAVSMAVLVAAFAVFGAGTPLAAGAVAAVAGLGLILTRDSALATRFTGHPAMVWIGQRSYAIYLVHWPLVVLYKYGTGGRLAPLEQVGLGVASVLGAMALHTFVEQRFRLRSGPPAGRIARHAVAATLAMLVVGMTGAGLFWGQDGFPGRQPAEIRAAVASAQRGFAERLELVRQGTCHASEGFTLARYDDALCAALVPDRVNVLVIGDSVAADVYLMLKKAYPGVAFAQATGGSCPPLPSLKRYSGCEQINRHRFDTLLARDYDFVVFAANWSPTDFGALADGIARARERGHRVVLFGPSLRFREDAVRLVSMSRSLMEAKHRLRRHENRRAELVQQMQADFGADVAFVDYLGTQCPRLCDALREGELLYIDRFHLSPRGAERFGTRLGTRNPGRFAPVQATAGR